MDGKLVIINTNKLKDVEREREGEMCMSINNYEMIFHTQVH